MRQAQGCHCEAAAGRGNLPQAYATPDGDYFVAHRAPRNDRLFRLDEN
jgi:hypothetical protein